MINVGDADAQMVGRVLKAETFSLPPELSSSSQARRLVVDFVQQWSLDELRDSAALCATELATNAVLHAREPFVLTVRAAGAGLRIDVLDNCPQHLPISTPHRGTAVDLTSWGTGGRGMQIVASLAHRWGVFTTHEAKTVWVEVRAEPTTEPPDPVLSLVDPISSPATTIELTFLDLPVRAAVASGIQTEEVIREIQLDLGSVEGQSPTDIVGFFELVDRSAPVRLAGRHAALRAAANGDDRFDLKFRTTLDALIALPLLAEALASFELRHELPLPVLTSDVMAFRAWLNEEVVRQRAGTEPMPCPLP